jgi:hypothetical protein
MDHVSGDDIVVGETCENFNLCYNSRTSAVPLWETWQTKSEKRWQYCHRKGYIWKLKKGILIRFRTFSADGDSQVQLNHIISVLATDALEVGQSGQILLKHKAGKQIYRQGSKREIKINGSFYCWESVILWNWSHASRKSGHPVSHL